jgi:long-chain acyl-CoA synthetase
VTADDGGAQDRRPSYDEIHADLCAPGQFFEIEVLKIAGVPTRTWKNAPATLGQMVTQGAQNAGSRDFIVLGDERINHERHLELVNRLAATLVDDLGIQKGDRVAIAMRNLPEWSVAFFAATMIGAIAVPFNAFWNGEELAFAMSDCDPKILFADGERLERLAGHPGALKDVVLVGTHLDDRKGGIELPAGIRDFGSLVESDLVVPHFVEVESDDVATIFYTSGMTGKAKGVLGTHRNICSNLMSLMFSAFRGMQREDDPPGGQASGPPVLILSVPLFHATGCHSMLLSQAFFGGTLLFMRRWDPEVALDLIEREKVTAFSGVPTMAWDIMNSESLDRRDLSSVKSFGGGGSAAPPELVRRIHERFPDTGVATGYGLTETSSVTTSIGGSDYLERPDSVGVPVPVCEVRLVDLDGRDVPAGADGEIWIKGPNVVPGYWRRPEETVQSFTDGWLHSGDIGRFDDEGFLYIVDRIKDVIIRGGENISTIEVEAVLFEHPAVLDAVVFATPHSTLGEEVGAVVLLRSGMNVTNDELHDHAASRLAHYKVPANIWLTDQPFPRSGTGKTLKREIQTTFASRVPGQ